MAIMATMATTVRGAGIVTAITVRTIIPYITGVVIAVRASIAVVAMDITLEHNVALRRPHVPLERLRAQDAPGEAIAALALLRTLAVPSAAVVAVAVPSAAVVAVAVPSVAAVVAAVAADIPSALAVDATASSEDIFYRLKKI